MNSIMGRQTQTSSVTDGLGTPHTDLFTRKPHEPRITSIGHKGSEASRKFTHEPLFSFHLSDPCFTSTQTDTFSPCAFEAPSSKAARTAIDLIGMLTLDYFSTVSCDSGQVYSRERCCNFSLSWSQKGCGIGVAIRIVYSSNTYGNGVATSLFSSGHTYGDGSAPFLLEPHLRRWCCEFFFLLSQNGHVIGVTIHLST